MRCVHCSGQKSAHDKDTLACPLKTVRTFYATMELPPGQTCADCVHFKRTCEWLISCTPERTQCDWWPIRFVAIAVKVGGAQ